jgi:hypothetical protein
LCLPKATTNTDVHQWPVAVFGYSSGLVMMAIATFFGAKNVSYFSEFLSIRIIENPPQFATFLGRDLAIFDEMI